jgi:tetratricopeptide (TPR) repeat protein
VFLILPTADTECFQIFLNTLAKKYSRSYILLFVDGAGNHNSGGLVIPSNITLSPLPPYSPELNPQENIWDEIREKVFKNYALKSMDAVYDKLEEAAIYMERNRKIVKSIASFPYIVKSSWYGNGIRKEEAASYDFTEEALIDSAYQLLAQKRADDAIQIILKLEVENYPKYWNAYDSLGDAYKAAGQNGLAIANYKRALELNPADDKAMEQRLTPGAPAWCNAVVRNWHLTSFAAVHKIR